MRRAVVVLVCLAVVLGGCRPSPDADAMRDGAPTFTELTVPASLTPPTETAWGLGLLAPAAPADAVPGVLVGVRADRAGVPGLGVWAIVDDDLTRVPADPGVPGAVVAAVAAASAELTAIAGYTWDDGQHHAFVLVSTDRATWTPVELPDDAAQLRLEAVTVAGTAVHVGATDPDGGLWSVSVTDDGAHVVALGTCAGPDDGAGKGAGNADAGVDEVRVSPTGIAARGAEVVVVGAHETAAGTLHHAYRSADAGRTWAEPVAMEHDDRAFMSGVVATSTGWVAVGGLPPGTSSDVLRPAAWRSDDGAYWVREDVVPDALDPGVKDDAWLTGVSAAGDVLASLVLIRSSTRAFLLDRSSDGVWSVRAEADGSGVHGEFGFAAPPSGAGALRPDGGLDVVLFGAGIGRVDRVAADGTWTAIRELGAPFRPYAPYRPVHRDGAVVLTFGRERFETTHTGWTRTAELMLAESSGADLRQRAWDPDAVSGAIDVVQASAPDGTEVVLSAHLDGRAVELHGHVRGAGAVEWREATGFERDRFEEVAAVTWTEHGWFAVGHVAEDLLADDRAATLWTSHDGAAWTRLDDVEWPSGADLAAVCRAADGRALVVGAVGDSGADTDGDEKTAGGWLTDGDTMVEVTGLGGEGSVSGCLDQGDRAVLSGDLEGRSTLWTLDRDATEATVVHTAARSDSLGLPARVEGGWAAWGRVEGVAYTGPVVWLSRDLTTWWSLPIPTPVGATRGVVFPDRKDVLVVASTHTGVRAWRVTGVPDVLRAGPAAVTEN